MNKLLKKNMSPIRFQSGGKYTDKDAEVQQLLNNIASNKTNNAV